MSLFKLLDKYNAQMEKVISPLDRDEPDYDLAYTCTLPHGKMTANVFTVDPQQIQENTRAETARKGKWWNI